MSQIAGSSWSNREVQRFFKALNRYSRHLPDSIAREVRTKNVQQVCKYIRRLEAVVAQSSIQTRMFRRAAGVSEEPEEAPHPQTMSDIAAERGSALSIPHRDEPNRLLVRPSGLDYISQIIFNNPQSAASEEIAETLAKGLKLFLERLVHLSVAFAAARSRSLVSILVPHKSSLDLEVSKSDVHAACISMGFEDLTAEKENSHST
eukprot:ANDGO_07327.mRNA.1 hypothetical protein